LHDRFVRGQGHAGEPVNNRRKVPDAMLHFSKQQVLLFAQPTALGDVTGDLERPDHLAAESRIGDTVSDISQKPAVLTAVERFVMLDTFAPTQTCENGRFTRLAGRPEREASRLPNDLLSRVAEQPFRSTIPTDDGAVEVFRQDGVVGRFHDRREILAKLVNMLGLKVARCPPRNPGQMFGPLVFLLGHWILDNLAKSQ
jgi:hypothetical protein